MKKYKIPNINMFKDFDSFMYVFNLIMIVIIAGRDLGSVYGKYITNVYDFKAFMIASSLYLIFDGSLLIFTYVFFKVL